MEENNTKKRNPIKIPINSIFVRVNAFLPTFTKSFYFIIMVLFLVWMFFFDSNDFLTQYQRNEQLKALEAEKNFYKEQIKIIEQKNQRILSNKNALERFGRENYFLKKPQEDVYIIVQKRKPSNSEEEKTATTEKAEIIQK